ncbi:MAG: hypothetical protein Q4G23_08700, partial [Clostridia bacterium]|nr:hypothetical protein [Clostridia bacterium]
RTRSLEKFFKDRNTDITLEFEVVGRFDLEAIKERLLSVISRYPEPVLDLTGGRELVLTAAGEISATCNIPIIQFDVKSGRVIPVKNAESIPESENPDIKIRDIITLNGGTLLPEDANWVLDSDFCEDIMSVFNICRENCGLWNRQATVFSYFEKYGKLDSFFRVSIDLVEIKRRKKEYFTDDDLIEKLK